MSIQRTAINLYLNPAPVELDPPELREGGPARRSAARGERQPGGPRAGRVRPATAPALGACALLGVIGAGEEGEPWEIGAYQGEEKGREGEREEGFEGEVSDESSDDEAFDTSE